MKNNHKLTLLFKTFADYPLDEIDLNVFALADAAQDSSFLKVLEDLRQKCLLKEASGEKAKKISPHLLELPQNFSSSEWAWLEKNVAGTAKMTLIISPLSFDALYQHLRHFLDVEFEGGLEMILAFWDPLILATLVGNENDKTLYVPGPTFTQEQRNIFLGPIQSWWYWDGLGHLQTIFGLNEQEEQLSDVKTPIQLNVAQEEMLVEATLPNHLVYYLRLNNSFLVNEMSDLQLYEVVVNAIPDAREYNLSGTRDILNFICLKLLYKESFFTHAQLQMQLEQVKNQKMSMDDVMTQMISVRS